VPAIADFCRLRRFAGMTERCAGDRDDFWSWRQQMYDLALRVTPEALRQIATRLYRELLRGGWHSRGRAGERGNKAGGAKAKQHRRPPSDLHSTARRRRARKNPGSDAGVNFVRCVGPPDRGRALIAGPAPIRWRGVRRSQSSTGALRQRL
jgi:hypothetical protein